MTTLSVRAVRAAPVRHPEWWLYAVAAAAGLVLVVEGLPGGAGQMQGMPDTTAGPGLDHWFLMVLAMMLPMAAPQARLVALRSLWPRRHRSAVVFTVGVVGVWLAVGAALTTAVAWLGVDPSVRLAATLLVLAGGWQVSPLRRRLLRRCGSVRLRAADGRAADLDCLAAGGRAGALCVAGCGAAMVPMAVAPMDGSGLVLMAGVLVVLLRERASGPNPAARVGRPQQALALLGLAVFLVLVPGLSVA